MSWVCRLVDAPTEVDRRTPGVLFYAPWLRERTSLSVQYRRDWADKRDPICLVIPGYGPTCLDQEYYPYTPGQERCGWTITGDAPLLTASPSLGIGSRDGGGWWYHGWLRNGVLSDDVDGRVFP